MTVLAFLGFLILFTLCGIAPALLLLPADPRGHRILLIPSLGLCSGTLVTYGLAAFGLTGPTIAELTITFFVLITVIVATGRLPVPTFIERRLIWRPTKVAPFTRKELTSATLPLFAGAATIVLIAWPLFFQGYEQFWGFANPDQPFYLTILKYLQTHAFGLPEGYASGPGATAAILGISYFFSMLVLITHIPIQLLFGIACAAVLFLIPISTFLLAEGGFRLSRKVSLVACFSIAGSALMAQTFYLHSLGALTVAALVPVAVTLAILYAQSPSLRNALLLAVVIGGMYYCYFPGIGVMGVVVTAVVGRALLGRTISFPKAIGPAVLAASFVFLLFYPQATAILRRLFDETFSQRLAVSASSSDEVVLSFGLVITEQGLPFLWGLSQPGIGPGFTIGSPQFALATVFILACVLLLVLVFSMFQRVSGLSKDHVWALAALSAVICSYAFSGNGYGVFKLVALIQPLLVIALIATFLGAVQAIWNRSYRLLVSLPLLLLSLYLGINIARTWQLGRQAAGVVAGTMPNLRDIDLSSFRELGTIGTVTRGEKVLVGLPDAVAQLWTVPFMETQNVGFLPLLSIHVQDSNSDRDREEMSAELSHLDPSWYLLHWKSSVSEIVPPPSGEPVWENAAFALTRIMDCPNTLVLGKGWYRKEQYPSAGVAWLSRFHWLRKRAEVILLNPISDPQRLRLTLLAGPGNPSAKRHVVIWLNGHRFDEIEFTGYARVLSHPFIAVQPWAQIELEIKEDAQFIPREHGFLNAWVPLDPRRLNVAVSEFSLVPAEENDDLDTSLDLSSQRAFTHASFDGIYPDRWVAEEAKVELRVPTHPSAIEISGMLPGVSTFRYPYHIQALLNGESAGEQWLAAPGAFHLTFPLKLKDLVGMREANKASIVVKPQATFVGTTLGTSNDARALSILLDRISIVGDGASTSRQHGKTNTATSKEN